MRYSYGFSDWRGMVGSTGGDVSISTTTFTEEREVEASAKSRKK